MMGQHVPFVPKLGFSCNDPATLQPLANRLHVDEAGRPGHCASGAKAPVTL